MQKNMTTVIEVLSAEEMYNFSGAANTAARSMLVDGLPHAVVTASGARHHFQEEMINLAATVFESARVQAATEVDGHAAKAEAIRGDIATAQQGVEVASGIRAAAETVKQDKIRDVSDADIEAQNAEIEHLEADKLARKDRDDLTAQQMQKATLDNSVALVSMSQDGLSADHVSAVVAELKTIGAETSLIAGAAFALTLPSAKRGLFDAVTINEISQILKNYGTELVASISLAAEKVRDTEAQALGLWALFDVSREAHVAALQAQAEAETSLEAAMTGEKAAKTVVTQIEASFSNAMVEQTLAEERVRQLVEAQRCLEVLRSPPVEVAPEPPVVEEMTMATEEVVAEEALATEQAIEASADVEMTKAEENVDMDKAESEGPLTARPGGIFDSASGLRVPTPLMA